MARKDKDPVFGEESPSGSPKDEAQAQPVTETTEVVEVAESPESSAPEAPQVIRAMNVSPTLLHLDNGQPFAPRSIADLTPTEFARFNRFRLIALK